MNLLDEAGVSEGFEDGDLTHAGGGDSFVGVFEA